MHSDRLWRRSRLSLTFVRSVVVAENSGYFISVKGNDWLYLAGFVGNHSYHTRPSRDPFFSGMMFLSGRNSKLVSSRGARYGLVWLFSILVYSPRDKRGKSCSRNGGLRSGIRADNRRFLRQPEKYPPLRGNEKLIQELNEPFIPP
jgi:hypothetical protein